MKTITTKELIRILASCEDTKHLIVFEYVRPVIDIKPQHQHAYKGMITRKDLICGIFNPSCVTHYTTFSKHGLDNEFYFNNHVAQHISRTMTKNRTGVISVQVHNYKRLKTSYCLKNGKVLNNNVINNIINQDLDRRLNPTISIQEFKLDRISAIKINGQKYLIKN